MLWLKIIIFPQLELLHIFPLLLADILTNSQQLGTNIFNNIFNNILTNILPPRSLGEYQLTQCYHQQQCHQLGFSEIDLCTSSVDHIHEKRRETAFAFD